MSNEKGVFTPRLKLMVFNFKVTASKFVYPKDKTMRKSFLHSINLYRINGSK